MEPWAEIASLALASNASFHDTVIPLAEMTKLTYTATFGTYFKPEDRNATVAGWDRDLNLTENPKAGMRALFFVQAARGRGVVAFRGTDLNVSGVSGQADRCADAALFGLSPAAPYCSHFSAETLDYLSGAVHFAERVRTAYPRVSLLFTGHSLGAGLAFAVAAVLRSQSPHSSLAPSVSFASPAWLLMLGRKAPHARPTPAETRRTFYALADEWDPVQRDSVHRAGIMGTECLWTSPEPAACAACYAQPSPINGSTPACELCFAERHVYAHYLKVDVPGSRPACRDVPAQHLEAAVTARSGEAATPSEEPSD